MIDDGPVLLNCIPHSQGQFCAVFVLLHATGHGLSHSQHFSEELDELGQVFVEFGLLLQRRSPKQLPIHYINHNLSHHRVPLLAALPRSIPFPPPISSDRSIAYRKGTFNLKICLWLVLGCTVLWVRGRLGGWSYECLRCFAFGFPDSGIADRRFYGCWGLCGGVEGFPK